MSKNKCLLCHQDEATKTNSHIIPSFLVAMFTSSDGSGKRDTEVMFTISNKKATTVYAGRSVSPKKTEELFDTDKLTDERIESELENNTASRDYVFCPECEKKMGDYLESPYSSHVKEQKKVDGVVAYFFWLSIIWRMSIVGGFGVKIPEEIESALGKSLNQYLDAKESRADVKSVVEDTPFCYKLIHCQHYCKTKSGFEYTLYNGETVDLMVGDYLLRCYFDKGKEFPNPPFYGAENFFADAETNDGTKEENELNLSNDEYSEIVNDFITDSAHLKLLQLNRILDSLWNIMVSTGTMPDELKTEFVENYLSDDIKLGERHTKHNMALAFQKVLANHGYFDEKK